MHKLGMGVVQHGVCTLAVQRRSTKRATKKCLNMHISLGHPLYANVEQDRTFGGFSQGGVFAQRGHSAGTAPIITLFIPGTPLKTTHLQKHA